MGHKWSLAQSKCSTNVCYMELNCKEERERWDVAHPHSWPPQSMGFINHFPYQKLSYCRKWKCLHKYMVIKSASLTLKQTGRKFPNIQDKVQGEETGMYQEATKGGSVWEVSKQKGKWSASCERAAVWDYVSGDDWKDDGYHAESQRAFKTITETRCKGHSH